MLYFSSGPRGLLQGLLCPWGDPQHGGGGEVGGLSAVYVTCLLLFFKDTLVELL